MDCKRESNKEGCVCAADTCDNHGVCCDCLRNHLSRKSLPACLKKLDWIKVVRD